MKLWKHLLILSSLLAFFISLITLTRRNAFASSFLSNQGVTKVTMRILPCEKEKDENGVEKCKKPKKESEPSRQTIPLVITDNNPEYPGANIFERSLMYIKDLLGIQ